MNLRVLSAVILIMPFLASCVHSVYLQSPMQANTNSYKAIPLQSENIKSSTNISGGIITGSANQSLRDENYGFVGSLYRSHNVGRFQGFYGATGVIGKYHVDPDYFYTNNATYESLYNKSGEHKYYGAWGFNGGINYVQPFRNGGEWRIIGAEVSWTREFGDYNYFRKNIPDSMVRLVDRHRDFTTLSINSDFVFRLRKRGSIGYKLGYVTSLTHLQYSDRNYGITPGYFSQTFHFSRDRFTGFWQTNFGSYAISSMLGVSYRL